MQERWWLRTVFRHWDDREPLAMAPAERGPVEARRIQDLANRMRTGVLFYPLVWALVGAGILVTDPSREKWLWILMLLVLQMLLTAGRLWLIGLTKHQVIGAGLGLARWLELGVFISGFSWSLILLSSLLDTPLAQHYPLIMTATMGLCSGVLVNLAISERSVVWFLLALFSLPCGVLVVGPVTQPPGLALVFLVYAMAMYLLTGLPRNEYEQSVLANLRLQQQARELTELSHNDALTGLRNRRYFETTLAAEYQRGSRHQYPLSLLIVDIDFFKRVNDAHGHLVGDLCLRHVALEIRGQFLRSQDTVARLGGEEFVIVLPGLDRVEGARLANNLLNHIRSRPFVHDGICEALTVSIGGACTTALPRGNPAELLNQADQALYQAKRGGRNQVVWSAY